MLFDLLSVLPFCNENMAAWLNLLNGQKEDRHLDKCRAYPSASKRRKKQEAKMRQEEIAAKSRNIQVTGSAVQRRHFWGTCKRTENRRTCCDRLRSM